MHLRSKFYLSTAFCAKRVVVMACAMPARDLPERTLLSVDSPFDFRSNGDKGDVPMLLREKILSQLRRSEDFHTHYITL